MTAQGATTTTANSHHLARFAPAVSIYGGQDESLGGRAERGNLNAFLQPYSIEYRALANGDGGTFQTLDAMRDAVLGRIPPDFSGYQDEFNIRAATNICASVPGQNQRARIAALFDFCAHKIQYLEHPINQQICQDARRTIEIGSGDCVSLSVLLATLLACLGYQPYFIAQCLDGEEFSHVYVGLRLNGEELRLDPVASDKPMGWSQKTLDGGFEASWPIFGD